MSQQKGKEKEREKEREKEKGEKRTRLFYQVHPKQGSVLEGCDADSSAGFTPEAIAVESKKLSERLTKLQEALFLAQSSSVLIIFQGMDTAGKDSTISRVMRNINPAGCRVESFKVPTQKEKDHDFLWRVHKVVPEVGNITVFNRSHYEDVLITRINGWVSDELASKRFELINNFEKLLVENGTIVIKMFLYISKDEQRRRLIERGNFKPWKLEPADWIAHKDFEKYMKLYNDVFMHCSTDHAPWFIIPANKKWLRDYIVKSLLVEIFTKMYEAKWKEEINKLTHSAPAAAPPPPPPASPATPPGTTSTPPPQGAATNTTLAKL